jgi:cytochrome c oxidase subunit 2
VDKRHEYAGLESIFLPIAFAVFGLVCLAVAFAGLRAWRKRRRGEPPSHWKENNPLEIGYAVVLTIVTAVLIYLTYSTEDKTDAVAGRPGLEIKAVAGQWNWRFSYPAYGVTVQQTPTRPAEFVVPTGTTVHFTGTSQDVIHAFYVPERRFKRDLFPGRNSSFDLMWPKPVSDVGHCAEFCGLRHAEMSFHVRAVPPAAFRSWVEAHR